MSNATAGEAYFIQTGERGIALPDPIAMAILLRPELVLEASEHFVDIETQSPLTRGMTVVDRLGVTGDSRNEAVWRDVRAKAKPAKICWSIDVAGWKNLLKNSLA